MNKDYLPKKKRFHSGAPPTPPFIPDEIIAEILCLLPVKTILQLRCVCKAWKTLISDPAFVQKHFQKSSQNPQLLFAPPEPRYHMRKVKCFPVLCLLESDPSIIVSNNNFHGRMGYGQIVGTCNGLLCLFFHFRYQKYWFRLWNPATGELSKKLGTFQDYHTIYDCKKFNFGCDISTGTYKVFALSKVWEGNTYFKYMFRVLSLGDNCWRTFQYCASIPVCLIYDQTKRINNGVHLNGIVNWLALPSYIQPCYYYNWKAIANAQQFVIVSLHLSTETCTQFLLPPGFDEVSFFLPTLNVLMDCLCFSHDLKETEFVIWQMKEFGVQKSWTMLFKINYIDIKMHNHFDTPLLPLYLSKNGETCILTSYEDGQVVVYNQREKRLKRNGIEIGNELCWFSSMEYVESLISTG